MTKSELIDVGDDVTLYGQLFKVIGLYDSYALLQDDDGYEYEWVDIELLDIE